MLKIKSEFRNGPSGSSKIASCFAIPGVENTKKSSVQIETIEGVAPERSSRNSPLNIGAALIKETSLSTASLL